MNYTDNPFDISELTVAIESKISQFTKKISPEVLTSAGISSDKAEKMYNSIVTFMAKKGWLCQVEADNNNRVICHNWKETADHLINQGYFDGDNITEIGHKYLRQLYKTIAKKAGDNGWTIDEMIVKAKDDAKAKAIMLEIVKLTLQTIGIGTIFASAPLSATSMLMLTLASMVIGDTAVNNAWRVGGYYEGTLKQRDTSAFESIANTLDDEADKEVEKNDNKKENFIDLSSLYKVEINPGAIDNYKERFHQLYHINKNARKLCGYMYFMNSTGDKGDLVGFFSVKTQSGKNWIDTLEISPKYRGNKLSHQMLDIASKEFGATDTIIPSDNKFAMKVFNKYGFMPYLEKDGSTYLTTDSETMKNSNYKPTKESVEPATEGVFKKPSKDEYTKNVIEHQLKVLNTPEKRVKYEKLLTDNMAVFKSTITALKRLEFKHERSIIDEKTYIKEKKTAMQLLTRLASAVGVSIKVYTSNSEGMEGLLDAYDALRAIKQSL